MAAVGLQVHRESLPLEIKQIAIFVGQLSGSHFLQSNVSYVSLGGMSAALEKYQSLGTATT
jgi:hypothetical protein